jgi:hypothetical protein
MEHIKIEIKGNINKYAELTAEVGYCFYDIDDERKYYMIEIATPILDYEELKRKYIIIKGDANKLNEEIEEKENLNG